MESSFTVFPFLGCRLVDSLELYLGVSLWLISYELPLKVNTDMEFKQYNE